MDKIKLGVYTDHSGDIVEILEIIEESRKKGFTQVRYNLLKICSNAMEDMDIEGIAYFNEVLHDDYKYLKSYSSKLWKVINSNKGSSSGN